MQRELKSDQLSCTVSGTNIPLLFLKMGASDFKNHFLHSDLPVLSLNTYSSYSIYYSNKMYIIFSCVFILTATPKIVREKSISYFFPMPQNTLCVFVTIVDAQEIKIAFTECLPEVRP